MGVLIFCIVLVSAAVLLHLLSLRIRISISKNPIVHILFLFFIVLICGLIIAFFIHERHWFLPYGVWQYIHVIIFYVPVMLSYVITFVALEDDSPTMTIVRYVQQAGERGRNRTQIGQIISNEALLVPRITTMVKDGWIECRDARYYITEKGRLFNTLFNLGLRLLNIQREG